MTEIYRIRCVVQFHSGQFRNVITIPVCPVISPSSDSDDKESESDSDSDYEDEHSKEDGHDH